MMTIKIFILSFCFHIVFFGMVFLMVICLHFSIRISALTNQVRRLTQHVAILDTEKEDLRKALDEPSFEEVASRRGKL